MSRIAPKPGSYPVPPPDVRDDIVSHTLRRVSDSPLDRAVVDARDALLARQDAQGFWLFELEADCTIPAEYIMMMHFLDEIDAALEAKIATCAPPKPRTAAGPSIMAATSTSAVRSRLTTH